MVIKNRLRFFMFFFVFVLLLFVAVKSCVHQKSSKYVEVDADKVSPLPKEIKNSKSLVHFIEEVKETNKNKERELSTAEIEAKELEEQIKSRKIKSKIIKKPVAKKKIKKKRSLNKKVVRVKAPKSETISSKNKIPSSISLSGGVNELNGFSRAKLESYGRRLRNSSAKKIYITGFFLNNESKTFGFSRAEKVKSILIGAGVRNKTIYVFSKKVQRSPSNQDFEWSNIKAL